MVYTIAMERPVKNPIYSLVTKKIND